MNIPRLTIKETVEPLYSTGKGGKHIITIGTRGEGKGNPKKVYEFSNYDDARKYPEEGGIGPQNIEKSNPLLKAIENIFAEAEIKKPLENLGIDKIYAIDIGIEPTVDQYIQALQTITKLTDIEIELYIGLNDLKILNIIANHLTILENQGIYHIALASAHKNSTIEELKKITDPTDPVHINHSRIIIHTNPDMLAAFTSKIACTPYHVDPAYGSYRSKQKKDIKILDPQTSDELVGAGLVVDWPAKSQFSTSDEVEPCMAISTNYRLFDGDKPVDSLLHHRLVYDHYAHIIDTIVAGFLKQNNTEVVRHLAEQKCQAYLQKEVETERLAQYTCNIQSNPSNPYSLTVQTTLRPMGTIYEIIIYRIIQTPTPNIGGIIYE
jgi:hypothetical protein